MNEHDIQNAIRIAISENRLGVAFRTNVGQAWTGERIERNHDGSITIYSPRPFKSGLPEGFSDLLVVTPIVVTSDLVGKRLAIAGFIEVKSPNGKPTAAQFQFLTRMLQLGAKAGVARSVEDALNILRS